MIAPQLAWECDASVILASSRITIMQISFVFSRNIPLNLTNAGKAASECPASTVFRSPGLEVIALVSALYVWIVMYLGWQCTVPEFLLVVHYGDITRRLGREANIILASSRMTYRRSFPHTMVGRPTAGESAQAGSKGGNSVHPSSATSR